MEKGGGRALEAETGINRNLENIFTFFKLKAACNGHPGQFKYPKKSTNPNSYVVLVGHVVVPKTMIRVVKSISGLPNNKPAANLPVVKSRVRRGSIYLALELLLELAPETGA